MLGDYESKIHSAVQNYTLFKRRGYHIVSTNIVTGMYVWSQPLVGWSQNTDGLCSLSRMAGFSCNLILLVEMIVNTRTNMDARIKDQE